ncbi:MAG TPA: quinone-dependent dihydroorotate dehydrogenase, partial [Longimicrobiaceae bacterium]|nr:quinone-dependent dihydroorotate dehydrogenase [Longimicrobiaceae bacterium]
SAEPNALYETPPPVGPRVGAFRGFSPRPLVIPYALLRPLLFALPAEAAHELASTSLRSMLATPALRSATRRSFAVEDRALEITRWGIRFPNPVGLAAGFDKTGESFNALGALGFGFVEIGTVTARAQPGNPRPRLFRLPDDQALLNRMGFNNPGATAVAERLARTRIEPVLGINLGKSKVTPLEEATADYLFSLQALEAYARYLVVNVSSPNTSGLRQLQDAGPLRELLRTLRTHAAERAHARGEEPRPLLVKIAPDLSDAQVEEAVEIAATEGAAGIVAVNTTISREGLRTSAARLDDLGNGGISGAPVQTRALEVVSRIYRHTGGALPIIAVGGIFTAEHAWAAIRAGASLVQLYTGFVYRGPTVAREINRGLLTLLRREGLSSVEQAVGAAAR